MPASTARQTGARTISTIIFIPPKGAVDSGAGAVAVWQDQMQNPRHPVTVCRGQSHEDLG
jgi:hypothetical protein